MSIWKRRWLLRRLTIALAVGAIAAPAAQARPAGIAPGEPGFASGGTQLSEGGPGSNGPLYYKAKRETASDPPLVGPQGAPVQVIAPDSPAGFGWDDAGIFVGGGLGAVLLATSAMLAVRQRGRFAGA